jgi:hypothetical protein
MHMKKIFTSLSLFLTLTFAANAQSQNKTNDDDTNCYLKWAQKFEERGADDVADGSYEDVIISFRNGSDAQCFSGKCEVKDGKVVGMYIRLENNTYEKVTRKLRDNFPITITNGMSKAIITLDDEIINVLFIKKIKPKKAGFQKAPEPTDD